MRLGGAAAALPSVRPLAGDLRDEQVADVREQVAAEVAQVVAARDEVFDDGQRRGRLPAGHRAHHAPQQLRAGDAEGGLHVRRLDLPLAETDDLIEGRLRVAHRALAGARDLR